MIRIYTTLFFCFLLNGIIAQDFYDLNKIHEVRIKFKTTNYDVILHKMKEEDKGERMVVDVTIDGQLFKDCGLRYKGNSSYFNTRKYEKTKLPINIKSDFVIKEQSFSKDNYKLKLSNVFRDPSYLREVMSYQIANKYMHSPKANFAKVYANDTYLGLYNNTESVESSFLKEKFGSSKGILVKCDPKWKYEDTPDCPKGDKASLQYLGDNTSCYYGLYEMKKGGEEGWKELVKLTKVLNKTPEYINKYLNVDQALWMLAFNNVLVNLDSYNGRLCHNYYLYKNPSSGIWEPIIWDMNLSFGGFRFVENKGLSNEEMATLSPFSHYKTKNPKRPLLVKLLENDLYRKMYIGHIKTIVEENFANGAYKKEAEKIRQRIDNEVRNDNNKLYPYEEYKKNFTETAQAGRSKIIGITELMEPRTAYLLAHPLLKQVTPTVEKPTAEKFNEKDLVIQAKVTDAQKVHVFYRENADKAWQRTEMLDDGAHNDQSKDDKIYGITLELKPTMQYYVVAEGKVSATCNPARASFEYHTFK